MLRPLTAVPLLLPALLPAQDWPGFRGPDGSGIAAAANPPLDWSADENIVWKAPLPGPGASSPVVLGDRIYVTCFSGYGADPDAPGEMTELTHHLVCLDRNTGEELWSRTVATEGAERDLESMAKYHGYASPTPVVDDARVYAYFGRTGIVAFDHGGEELWRRNLGTGPVLPERTEEEKAALAQGGGGEGGTPGLGFERGWGSAASPILCDDLLIVHAGDASMSLRALHRETGEPVWEVTSEQLATDASTPVLVTFADGSRELLLAVLGQLWGLDPTTGERRWTADIGGNSAALSTPATDGSLAFVSGAGTKAVQIGPDGPAAGEGRIQWEARDAAGIPSATLYEGTLYIIDRRGIPVLIDAETGEVLTKGKAKERLTGGVYASPVLAGDRLYVLGREGKTQVYAVDGEFELLASSQIEGDDSMFDGSPAVVGDRLYLRSNRFLYCIGRTE